MYSVIGTDTYLTALAKWPIVDQQKAKRVPAQLAENPFVGDTLTYHFLREKRVGGKRVYYLVYEDLKLVLLVATSAKKDQQATINRIKRHFEEFREIAEEIVKRES